MVTGSALWLHDLQPPDLGHAAAPAAVRCRPAPAAVGGLEPHARSRPNRPLRLYPDQHRVPQHCRADPGGAAHQPADAAHLGSTASDLGLRAAWPLPDRRPVVQRPTGAGGTDPPDARHVPRVPGHGEGLGGHGVARLRAAAWHYQASIGLVAILIVAAILRTLRLDTFPPGLYADVAANGLDALGVPRHGLQVIYPRGTGNGIEGMISWLDAVSVARVGAKPTALALTTVVIGLLPFPVHYLVGSRLFGRRVGLISAALLAVSFWA